VNGPARKNNQFGWVRWLDWGRVSTIKSNCRTEGGFKRQLEEMEEELRLSATAALAAGTGASAAVDKLAKSFPPKKARREKGPAGKQTKLKVAE